MSHLDAVAEDEVERLRAVLAATQAESRRQAELAATREREVQALRRVALAMNRSLELGDLLETIVEVALELAGAERAHVVWRDEQELDRLLASRPGKANWRLPDDAVRKIEAVRHVLETGEVHVAAEAMLVCLPLVAPGRVLGALCVAGPLPSQEALADLHVLASHAAIALENAVLFTALRRRSSELEAALARYENAEREAHTDPLTQIPNKRQFQEQGRREEAAAKRYGHPYSLIIGDIDHFKAVNDTHGHLVGDLVLKAVANELAHTVRGSDLLARWGGEEFVVLCPSTSRHEAVRLAERMREAIGALRKTDDAGNPLPAITISLGVATYGGGDDSLEAILERADRALLAAKAGGRNQVRTEERR